MIQPNYPSSLITQGPTELAFNGRVLDKYDINYYRCIETGFIQTEKPYWLHEAYSSAISILDVGCVQRNLIYATHVEEMIDASWPSFKRGLDYGGGYGLFVRLMRDKGIPFMRKDIFCENLFAKHFDIIDCPDQSFDLVTAFEVFEHLPNPIETVGEMFELAPSIIFSTELQPTDNLKSIDDWWYFLPESGQHISFYNKATLLKIAELFGACLFTSGNLHLITKDPSVVEPFASLAPNHSLIKKLAYKIHRQIGLLFGISKHSGRKSLLQDDFNFVKAKSTNT
jgi:hypothetical protein